MAHLLLLVDFLNHYPVLFFSLCFILGLLVGSFLNVVIYRLPLMMQNNWLNECTALLNANGYTVAPAHHDTATKDELSTAAEAALLQSKPAVFNLMHPHSHCPECKAPVKPWHNIPVLSYLLLAGRCASCRQSISSRYPLLELITGLLSAAIAWKFGLSWACLMALLLTWSLISLTMIDYDHQLLPDDITLPLIWLGLLSNYFGLFTSFTSAFWGVVFGYLSLWSIYWIFKLITGKEGMGYGDFKLLAALGAFLGWQMLLPIVLMASLSGTIMGFWILLKNRNQGSQPFAFGPYLAVGGWICLMFGAPILTFLNLA